MWLYKLFFFQAEDGIRYLVRSRGLGDVYKRQALVAPQGRHLDDRAAPGRAGHELPAHRGRHRERLSLIHI